MKDKIFDKKTLIILVCVFAPLLMLIAIILADMYIASKNLRLICNEFCPECFSQDRHVTKRYAEACIYRNIKNEISKKKNISRKEIHKLFSKMPSCTIVIQSQSGETWVCKTAFFFPRLVAPVEIFINYDRANNAIDF